MAKVIGRTTEGKVIAIIDEAELSIINGFDHPVGLLLRVDGDKLIKFRRQNGLSQDKLAKMIGISRNYLGSIERNKSNNLTAKTRLKILEVTGV